MTYSVRGKIDLSDQAYVEVGSVDSPASWDGTPSGSVMLTVQAGPRRMNLGGVIHELYDPVTVEVDAQTLMSLIKAASCPRRS